MANIGILSMQRIVNYGSFLQAYGLKKILESMGHTVQFVDYHVNSPIIGNQTKLGKLNKFTKVLEILKYRASFVQKIQYILYKKHFFKRYSSTLGLTKEMNYTPKVDVLIIGSDEVFNCIQQNVNVGYSLELFGENNNANRLISYAASFGNTTLKKLKQYKKDEEIGVLLQKFDALSVRDINSGAIIKALTQRDAEYHLDPVLAYDFINDCELIPDVKINERFLILYAYADRISSEEAKWIKRYAHEKKLKIYSIGGIQQCTDCFLDCSPFSVLAYFKRAECIITDTFHGSIFSIITNKPFVTIIRRSDGERYGNEEKITDLLRRLGLEKNKTDKIETIREILDEPINYNNVERILMNERTKTIAYLKGQI